MSIKSFEDFKLQGTLCQFIDTADVINAVSHGEVFTCTLKPSAEFVGLFVAEMWGHDPATQQLESQGILVTIPAGPTGDIDVLRGETIGVLKEALSRVLTNNIVDQLLVEEMPHAAPASWRSESRIVIDLAEQGGGIH